jgi:hypothetical protein
VEGLRQGAVGLEAQVGGVAGSGAGGELEERRWLVGMVRSG